MVSSYIIWIGLILLSLGLYGVVKLWPNGGSSKTFSQHAATQKSGVLYYILLFTITLPIFASFFYYWFIPTYQPVALFGFSMLIAFTAQYLCTLIPEVGYRRRSVHRILALFSALGLLFAVASALFGGSFSVLEQAILALGLLVMGFLLAVMIMTRAKHSKILYIQAGYFLAFFASILLVVYL